MRHWSRKEINERLKRAQASEQEATDLAFLLIHHDEQSPTVSQRNNTRILLQTLSQLTPPSDQEPLDYLLQLLNRGSAAIKEAIVDWYKQGPPRPSWHGTIFELPHAVFSQSIIDLHTQLTALHYRNNIPLDHM